MSSLRSLLPMKLSAFQIKSNRIKLLDFEFENSQIYIDQLELISVYYFSVSHSHITVKVKALAFINAETISNGAFTIRNFPDLFQKRKIPANSWLNEEP